MEIATFAAPTGFAAIAQPVPTLAKSIDQQLQEFASGYNPLNPNQILSPTPSRGVPDVFEIGKMIKANLVFSSPINSIKWNTSGDWTYGEAAVCLSVNGVEYRCPIDATQASALFATALRSNGQCPEFYVFAVMQERKPKDGVNRAPLKVARLYSTNAAVDATYISLKADSAGKVLPSFEAVGW